MEEVKEIYLAGGCFWGTEKYLSLIKGVISTEVGYVNGKTKNPTYQDVCYNNTGHTEGVKVVYNPSIISLSEILELYYDVINPVSINRQGNDVGSQYRSGIYYMDESDRDEIMASIKELQTKYEEKIAVEVLPLSNYTTAEEYHQKYLDKNPGGYCHIGPDKFEKAKETNK
ncbi:MAG: peptide-methionine (S)-S-oxide reductase MsrA [Firmicutes bacterium]|nr:peptide-methionine (S)-S-oxide reductase MsrA [Bacillota bacterium]